MVKGQTYVILSILFIILISMFAVFNITSVEVNYLFWKGSSPLIFVILASVLLGGVLTMIVGSKNYFRLKKENKEMRQQLKQFEEKGTHIHDDSNILLENDQENKHS